MSCGAERPGFLVLGRKAGWEKGLAVGLDVSDDGLALAETVEHAPDAAGAAGLAQAEGADFAVGPCGQVYIAEPGTRTVVFSGPGPDEGAPSGEPDTQKPQGGIPDEGAPSGGTVTVTVTPGTLRVHDLRQGRSEPVPTIAGALPSPAAVALAPAGAPGTLYVADREGANRLVALALLNWQIRWIVGAAADAYGNPLGLERPFVPFDLATDAAGRIYALTPLDWAEVIREDGVEQQVVPQGGRLAIAVFDRGGRLLRLLAPAELTLSAAVGLPELSSHLSLAAAPEGGVWVLEAPGRRVLQLDAGTGAVALTFSVDAVRQPAGLTVDGAGILYVGDARPAPRPGEEDDRFLHRFDAAGGYLGVLSGFRGAAHVLAVTAGDRIHVLDREARRLFVLSPRRTFRRAGQGPPSGTWYSPPLDSTRPGTRWHKLVMDADIPGNTQVRVSWLVLEERGAYDQALGAGDRQALDGLGWSAPVANPRDALIRAEAGRFLCLRLELVAVDRDAPRVRRAEAHFPRSSYLRHLPAVYQEDARGRDFLERFLALFETLNAGFEGEIEGVVRALDAEVVAGEMLAWLGGWLAVAADEGWPEERLRQLVLRAPELYRMRGTRAGIEALVEVVTGERPLVVEHFQRVGAEDPEIKAILERLYSSDPYGFCVLLKPTQVRNEEDRRAVVRLVEADKPAHTAAGVQVLQPWIYLDLHTYLGMNTYLTAPSPRLDTGAALSRDSVLLDVPEAGQVERRSRVGLDTSLS